MDFLVLYDWCDVIQSREFEGVSLNYTYTADQLLQINQTVLATLMLPMEDPVLCREMYVSKAIRSFLYQAENIVNGVQGYEGESIKYEIFSSHDWTVAQHMLFIDAVNGNFTNLPFASQIVYELHSTDGCSDAACFWVEVLYNNVAQEFENCVD